MANSSSFVLIFGLSLTAVIVSLVTVDASGEHRLSWVPTGGRCRGSIADCMESNEFEMESEISRRILATTQYISYGALQRNTVPCSLRGASYYNCKPGALANPYNRGCTAITRCRS